MIITVFTPTYNRANTLTRLYKSLCNQTNKEFEWLIINDGSTDETDSLIQTIIINHNDEFKIRYYKQSNLGLNRTINRAIDLALGKLFCRLDSDDYATNDMIESINRNYCKIEHNSKLCALVFLSLKPDGSLNGTHPFIETTQTNFNEYRDKYKATGDRSEVVKTEIYKKFKFPEIKNENFITESIVWNRMAKNYDALYLNKAIYVKGDGEDTITSKIYLTNKRCSKGVTLFYYEVMSNQNFSTKFRIIHAIKYYRYAFYAKANIFKGIKPLFVLIGLPIGTLVALFDLIKHK